ncbi:MAG TPA: hypothetical protein VE646_01700 [Actinomycetota bacterium]|jgi:hypothetical protein|nr:hypothetical protein [Actinomycetota bacterium]
MGQSADQKVTEIRATRAQVDHDLRELEHRLPIPLNGRTIGLLMGAGTAASLVLKVLSWVWKRRREQRARTANVVVHVVDERHGRHDERDDTEVA